MTSLRLAILGFVVVMVAAQPAEARRGRGGIVVINLGDDIMHLRQTSSEPVVGDDGTEAHLDQIGYHYQRFGLFWVDFWRWSGEYVLYSGDGLLYAPLTDAELEELGGAKFPLAYHLPPGFLGLLCAGIFGLIKRKSRSVKFCLIAGGALLAVALILFIAGLGLGAMIPGFLGLYHLAAAKFGAHPEADDDDVSAEPEPEQPRQRPSFRPSAPRVETDPFRAPPQQAPIHVERPSAPVVAPIAVDPNAEAPKLLR